MTIYDVFAVHLRAYIKEHNMEGEEYEDIVNALCSDMTAVTINHATYINDRIKHNEHILAEQYDTQAAFSKELDTMSQKVYTGQGINKHDRGNLIEILGLIEHLRSTEMTIRAGFLNALNDDDACKLVSRAIGTDKNWIKGQGLLISMNISNLIQSYEFIISTIRDIMIHDAQMKQ